MRSIYKPLIALLCVLFALASTPMPTPAYSQAETARLSEFGVNAHLASRARSFEEMDWQSHVISQSGAGWVREDFHWFSIEPLPGVNHWEYYDRMVDLHTANGLNIIGVLGHPPGWATREQTANPWDLSFYEPDLDRFARYASQVVERYRYRVTHWEIWNEPDNPNFWKPAPDPVAYARLLRTVSSAIRAVAPEVRILHGGINPFDIQFLLRVAENDAWWAFDILNIHPYVDPALPEDNGEIGVSAFANLQIVTSWAGGKPVWVTEFGWSARPNERDPAGHTDEEEQANYLVRGAVLLRAAGAERVIWYSMKDEIQNGYGMLRFSEQDGPHSHPRPALYAFAVLNDQLAGAVFEKRITDIEVLSGGPVYGFRFRRGNETIDVIWALRHSTALLTTTHATAQVFNRHGHSWWLSANHGVFELYPDPSPIYVHRFD
ncbi:MAG: hypothetical protein HC837_02680 [Chloroflexaceae bacterium]|nr:hypothetical protein [Chloroflexaceae bacterium]